ncbi:integrator complex assembly factor BRAT1 isoform X2 [Parambassis ranga]|uniref:Integrator complex assembly factor BRAT1 isoform X2 n=1 Tax=Parambassis ranga TaxID=210632 RepID=A0A6P7IG93_9TELE|nr:BRCA1-associated ATM activator 1 isoform X2 [Parambassis ranga]
MDTECLSLLPRVCEVLAASGSSLADDTSLEKLLDWIKALTEAGGSLLDTCPCLLKFISTVIHNTASDPSILSFTLKLTGLVGTTEDGFKILQESSVMDLAFNLQYWQGAGLWEDPCVRIGWIQGLRTMLQHPKALRFFVDADFVVPLLQLQTDTSLFVASAANQMLAHILLYCQDASAVGCKGIDGKREDNDDRRTHDSVVTFESHHVVMTISEYLKKSLVPKESTQLHQSVQVLKLLALLLAQSRPPLKHKLLQAVGDSLEELVTAEYSQLTLPLMDVLLSAPSNDGHVPDQHVTRLLSLMLSIKKPPELIHAAAAFLRRSHHDSVYAVQAVRVLLRPLEIVTGLTLGTNTADELWRSMVEQLKSKTPCISVICVCLTNMPQITLLASDCLPCPPVLIVTAVLLVLRLCSGDSSSSSAGCCEVFRNIIGSGKVQKYALEALTALHSSPGMKEMLPEVTTLLIQYLNNPDSDPSVLHKSYQALVKWMSVCTDLSCVTDKLGQDLIQVVRKRVCDVRWEVRDSTVEFLGHLAGAHVCQTPAEEAHDMSEVLLGGCCCTVPLLKEALQDPESYVRASAISALAQTLTQSWQQGAALTQEQTAIVTRLLGILSQDTEGFARRAVVRYFITWFSSSSSHSPSSSSSFLMQSVCSALSQGSADLDWEVKVYTLELAELLLDEAFSGHHGYTKGSDTTPSQPHPYAVMSGQIYTPHTQSGTHTEQVESELVGVLNSLVKQGVILALLSGLFDCDRPVCLKACQLLIKLRETVCPLSLGALDATADMATVAKVSCELPGWGWVQEIRKLRGKENGTAKVETNVQRSVDGSAVVHSDTVCVSVCKLLWSLGLEERLEILTQSSDHIHNSSLSLLQDILAASDAHTHADTQQGQEVIVDCY